MKKILPLLFIIAASLSACQKECDAFHEGKGCKSEVREKYIGQYNGGVSRPGTAFIGIFEIKKGNGGAESLDFNGAQGELTSSNTFEVSYQPITVNGSNGQIQGYGSFDGTILSFYYEITMSGATNASYFVGEKKP